MTLTVGKAGAVQEDLYPDVVTLENVDAMFELDTSSFALDLLGLEWDEMFWGESAGILYFFDYNATTYAKMTDTQKLWNLERGFLCWASPDDPAKEHKNSQCWKPKTF